jgi:hypothetical protein
MSPADAETRAAEALDRWLSARLGGGAAGPAPAELPLVVELVAWAESARPAPAFAEALGARLRVEAERLAAPTGGPVAGPGRAGPVRGAGRPAGRAARAGWAGWLRLEVAPRRWALAAVAGLVIVLAGLLAVPGVRAELGRLIQLGAVQIFRGPTPTPTAAPAAAPAAATPRPTATLVPTLLNLDGETTLAEALARATFPLKAPAYPADLGPPDHVFLQRLDGPAAVLVWLDPERPGRVDLSLHVLTSDMIAGKGDPEVVAEAQVNGARALWTTGPYVVAVRRRGGTELDFRRLVEGHVLVWTDGELTYRLETDQPLAEAVRMAESLAPLAPRP